MKNVSRHSNPPDELAQNVSKKNPFQTNYESDRVFNYLNDSNSIFRAGRIKLENFPVARHEPSAFKFGV